MNQQKKKRLLLTTGHKSESQATFDIGSTHNKYTQIQKKLYTHPKISENLRTRCMRCMISG